MANDGELNNELIKKIENQRNRNRALFKCATNWVEIKESGMAITDFFIKRKYRNIAIYGVGELGRLLSISLRNSDVKVKYFIDQAAETNRCKYGVQVHLPEEVKNLEPVDAIVVTPVFYFNEISSNLLQVDMGLPIVSLNSIMDECLGELWYGQHCKEA